MDMTNFYKINDKTIPHMSENVELIEMQQKYRVILN
jgi:hypothetical protein